MGKLMTGNTCRARAKPTRQPGDLYYTAEELEFLRAIDRYKRENRRPHPTWAEVLAVARALGYRKVSAEVDLVGVGRKISEPIGC